MEIFALVLMIWALAGQSIMIHRIKGLKIANDGDVLWMLLRYTGPIGTLFTMFFFFLKLRADKKREKKDR